MAQIAQQDNLVIEVTTTAAALDSNTKNKLIACIEGGTIADVVLVTKEVEKKIIHARVVSWLVDTTGDSPKYTIHIINANSGAVAAIALN
ncbi:hypothetical protein [Alistipes putredinis]|uniref:hypothetical protein n=1 Tax=Alistipes putredinis TaxID=28117 RepID=UPI003AB0855F